MFDRSGLRISRYEAQTIMPSHCHEDPSLNLVIEGAFEERIVGTERRYAEGHITFRPADTMHSQRFGCRGVRQIMISPRSDWLAYLEDGQLRLTEAPHARSAAFQQLARRLLAELSDSDAFSGLACEGILLEVVAAFGRHNIGPVGRGTPPAWLQAARDFIRENAFVPLSMQCLASAAGRHEIHVAREFRRFFGSSIGAYQRRLRVEEAARLLQRRGNDISEIAHACGFASHAHLCRLFKAYHGLTPSEYRRRHAARSSTGQGRE
jgi:AraC family transcriptional regulator